MTAEETAAAYDAEAEATGWLGPEIAFGLAYEYLSPGQSILDLGIGTGLASVLFRKAGLRVHGMDIAQEMLAACRWKGFDDLTRRDLAEPPYPYVSESYDHVICSGVLNFLSGPSPVFAETARLLKPGGMFILIVGDRDGQEDLELVIDPECTKTDESVTLHVLSRRHVREWIDRFGFVLVKSLPFPMYVDSERTESWEATCYVAKRA